MGGDQGEGANNNLKPEIESMSEETYIRTDERSGFLCSMRHCVGSLDLAANDLLQWKWVILSIHNALQGALVNTLMGSARFGALRDDSLKKSTRMA